MFRTYTMTFIGFIIVALFSVNIFVDGAGECNSYPCRNNAACVETGGKYLCQCQYGYHDINCQLQITGQTCGTTHYTPTGTIASPTDSQGLYSPLSYCAYIIRVAGAQRIQFTFT
ncbi:fibropellin-3-like [Saccoglossus kowalevskii]